MSNPKKHHYLSQFYLAGFTLDEDKKGTLYRYHIETKMVHSSKPINEGYVKHFNKLESHTDDQNILEKELSNFEGKLAEIIKRIQKTKTLPKNEDFELLIYYVALLGVRNPQIRSDFLEFQEREVSMVLEFMLRDEGAWNKEKKRIQEQSDYDFGNITYEEMKKFIYEKRWKLEEDNENKVAREIKSANTVFNILLNRNWSLLIINSGEDYFVTSDRPVKNIWSENNNLNFGPGFGLKNSEVYFPLNRRMILRGSFKNIERVVFVNLPLIGSVNSLQFLYRDKFIYSPTKEFIILSKGDKVIKSNEI